LVAGHYLPLADNPGVAPEPDQTRSLQSDQGTTFRNHLEGPRFSDRGPFRCFRRAIRGPPQSARGREPKTGAQPPP